MTVTINKILQGHRVGWLEYLDKGGKTIEILDLYVQPDCRRQGFAKELYQQLVQRHNGVGWTVLAFTRANNQTALLFYASVGLSNTTTVSRLYQGSPQLDCTDALLVWGELQ